MNADTVSDADGATAAVAAPTSNATQLVEFIDIRVRMEVFQRDLDSGNMSSNWSCETDDLLLTRQEPLFHTGSHKHVTCVCVCFIHSRSNLIFCARQLFSCQTSASIPLSSSPSINHRTGGPLGALRMQVFGMRYLA